MKLSYKKLWVKLVEQDMKKTEFAKKAGIKICEYLKCDIADIVEIVPDESSEEEN